MWTVTISLAQMDLSNFRWISRLFYPTTGCHWTHTIFKSRLCATAKWMWHIMTRIDPPLTVVLTKTQNENRIYACALVYTYMTSINKNSSTMTVWNSRTFQMHFFPSYPEMKRFFFHSGQTHTQLTKLRRHCVSEAEFLVSSIRWGN